MKMPKRIIQTRLIAFIGIIVAIGTSIAWLSIPHYIVLPLAAPMTHLPRGDWFLQERMIRTWSDSGGRYYVWRAAALAFQPDYSSWEDVTGRIDEQLITLGWELHPNPRGICGNHFAEAEFLPPGPGGYLAYTRTGDEPDEQIPRLCLAAWTTSSDPALYTVVIQTTNPAAFTVIDSWFR